MISKKEREKNLRNDRKSVEKTFLRCSTARSPNLRAHTHLIKLVEEKERYLCVRR